MVEKRVKNFGEGPPPPFSGNARKKSIFLWEVFPKTDNILSHELPHTRSVKVATTNMY